MSVEIFVLAVVIVFSYIGIRSFYTYLTQFKD